MMSVCAGWRWEECGSDIALSGEGLVATMSSDDGAYQLATGGEPMTEGRHYWEVELTKGDEYGSCNFCVGAARPGLDHDKGEHDETNGAYYIYTGEGSLFGHGKHYADPQGEFKEGDRVGVLLDLDAGWLRFYRNGKRCGPGFTEGVTGPQVRAAEVYYKGSVLTALPGAAAPAD